MIVCLTDLKFRDKIFQFYQRERGSFSIENPSFSFNHINFSKFTWAINIASNHTKHDLTILTITIILIVLHNCLYEKEMVKKYLNFVSYNC